ncbi:MAG TPA: hypothetical protein VEY11_02010 [Pyrinomonadaceae bacterium]|nr:hypothetical protein [Pyrinomonadaceae bacterium]
MSAQTTTTLRHPVGERELQLIRESGFREFPPRLPGQPIFYPVLNEEYAARIARDWNAKYNVERRAATSRASACAPSFSRATSGRRSEARFIRNCGFPPKSYRCSIKI